MNAPAVLLSTITMLTVGYSLSITYSEPCAKIPFFITQTECSPVFLFGLAYLTFAKIFTTMLGTRIRGVYFQQDSMYSSRYLRDFPLFKIVAEISNIWYIYRLLKTSQAARYFISITRIQSRLTGYICKCYVPICLRAPLFGLFGTIYGVNISEATRRYS